MFFDHQFKLTQIQLNFNTQFPGTLLAAHLPTSTTAASAGYLFMEEVAVMLPYSSTVYWAGRFVLGVFDLASHQTWKRISLILAGDVETNPGPNSNFPSAHCASSSPEQFPYTNKNVIECCVTHLVFIYVLDQYLVYIKSNDNLSLKFICVA